MGTVYSVVSWQPTEDDATHVRNIDEIAYRHGLELDLSSINPPQHKTWTGASLNGLYLLGSYKRRFTKYEHDVRAYLSSAGIICQIDGMHLPL